MKQLQFEVPIDGFPGFRADAVSDDNAYDVRLEMRDARSLRTALMEMARIASLNKNRHAILVLEEPEISITRLLKEWEGAISVIRPELSTRLSLVFRKAGQWNGIPMPPTIEDTQILEEVVRHETSRRPASMSRNSEAHYEILRILIHEWLLDRGPISINCLMETSGCSYPTVSRSLERLEHYLTRHSDRSVELRIFPREEWSRLLIVSDDVRNTVRFTDRSGHSRSPESLLRRLQSLQREDIGIGGILGAKHYYPPLDIIGNPQLQISIHSGRKNADLSFVEHLDPALERTTGRNEPSVLIIHTINRAKSLFQPNTYGLPWLDPVECLLDLHEARLEPQALEFFNSFPGPKSRPL
jgi:hypothetical protein